MVHFNVSGMDVPEEILNKIIAEVKAMYVSWNGEGNG